MKELHDYTHCESFFAFPEMDEKSFEFLEKCNYFVITQKRNYRSISNKYRKFKRHQVKQNRTGKV
jgi:hypothetical protein